MKLLAHITSVDGIRKEQTLKEHCLKTAEYAALCLESEKLYHTAYLAGVLHDMGKAKADFQRYLEDAFQGETVVRGSVNHTFAGVIWLFEHYHGEKASPWERLTSELIGYAIGAHHGLFDCVDMDRKNGFLHRLTKDREEISYEESAANYFSEVISEDALDIYFQKSMEEVRTFFQSAMSDFQRDAPRVYFQTGLMARLLLSALVYGDRRDTKEFMSQRRAGEKREIDWNIPLSFLEKKLEGLDASSTLNRVRSSISRQCLASAEKPDGIRRLNVPTGGGKTLSCLRYALAHAKQYRKKRIIFIIPLLSVLDQNSKVIREYTGDDRLVLEHHSNLVQDKKGVPEYLDEKELLAESWNGSPIIISTLVQLLNILFSSQMSAAGRMQALCDSVIVIDEVQSLPGKVTAMFNMAMNFLRMYCNTDIVFSSATQPCFEKTDWPVRLSEDADMVKLTKEQLELFRRAEIVDKTDQYGMDLDTWSLFCEELMGKHVSLLVICNTKEEARSLYSRMKQLEETEPWDVYHLSTSMCQRHRKEVLEEIHKKLKEVQRQVREGKTTRKLLCISTQLVEAGIDFSFEAVVRVLAGVDNLAQAAGRCNRSNEYGHKGTVYLMNLKNENLTMLPDIRTAQNCTAKLLENPCEENLIGDRSAERYYEYWFQETKKDLKYPVKEEGEVFWLADLLANKQEKVSRQDRQQFLLYQPFRWVGDHFRVFEENTIDILVPYKEGKELAEKFRQMGTKCWDLNAAGQLLRQARPYIISIYDWQRKKLDTAGLLEPLMEGRILALNEVAYDEKYGLLNLEKQKVENFIL